METPIFQAKGGISIIPAITISGFSNERYDKLENNFIELQKQNEILKEEIESLKSEIKNIKSNDLYIKDINIEKTINQMFTIFQESELTKNKCHLLMNWLNNKKLKFTKIYSTKIDGDSASKFHEKCDGKCPTITIIKTTKGIRFGGYTTIPWIKSNNWEYFKDSEAFIFSLLYKKKYMIKDSNQIAIGCHEIRGPSFGDDRQDIYIWENCTKTNENKCRTPYSYLITKKSELTNGDVNFTVSHYEVYLIDKY